MSKTINASMIRTGNFTSSEIVALTKAGKEKGSFGVPALTYISECNMERRLLRSISDEVSARPLCWGNLVEVKAFLELGMEYILSSQETLIHPAVDFWSGSPDGFKEDEGKTVIDIKCPMTLKSFCTFADCKDIQEIRENHKDGEKYYWQLVSNSIIGNCKYAELIVYMPYKSELQDIRDIACAVPQDQAYKFFWIANGNDEELPHLLDGGYYKNIYTFRFEVPESDKDLLTQRVLQAGKLLQPFHKPTAI
jgi:hypothetical protein